MSEVILLGLEQDRDKDKIISRNETSEFLGIGYVNAFLCQKGVESKVLCEPVTLDDVVREEPFIVGFSVMASNYEHSKQFSQQLKKANPNINVIWGGPQASTYYEEVLLDGLVDYVIIGEGEKTTLELIGSIRNSEELMLVKGLAFQRKGKIIKNSPRERLTSQELDSIDFRLAHEYNEKFAKHIPHSVPYSEMRFANVVGSRGCWNNCSFCSSNSIWGRKINYHSPENVVDEIEFLVNEKNVNYLFFTDDDFLVNGNWAQKIAGELLKRDIKIKYHVMGSVRSSLRFNNYELLKRSGCAEITVGMETANPDILCEIGKGYELSVLPSVANEITGHGIHFGLYYMVGYPQQTEQNLERDYEFISTLPFSRIRASFITPFPGTRFFSEVESNDLWIDGYRNNWSLLTCDRPVVKSRVTPEKLVEARDRIVGLYLQDNYRRRMLNFIGSDSESLKAFTEFQEYIASL